MLSVAICTHNPREAVLRRVLAALEAQTLPRDRWELLVIDNASTDAIAPRFDLSWHPAGRHVFEPALGLTRARLRAIAEATGNTLVFVDDDNILARDYLDEAGRIARDWPILGAWGGRIDPEFESPPPDWTRPFWHLLAIEPVTQPRWSNGPGHNHAVPPGAGQCVRATVAHRYAEIVNQDPLRRSFDRVGDRLSSCGDRDLALTATDLGLGTGQFPSLQLTHVIPPGRLEIGYLVRLVEEITCSTHLLKHVRGGGVNPPPANRLREWVDRWYLRKMPPRDRAFEEARRRAHRRALDILATVNRDSDPSRQP